MEEEQLQREKDKEIGKYTPQVDEDNPDSDKVES